MKFSGTTLAYSTVLLGTIALASGHASAQTAGSESTQSQRGRLAVAIYATGIHSRPTPNSRVLYRVPADMRLVVVAGQSGTWREVLLSTGDAGYVQNDALLVYPQEYIVTKSGGPRVGAPLSSRGGSRSRLNPAIAETADRANQFLGIPYKWGGNDTSGIDCSGLVKKLYGEVGVNLPRTAAEQALVGKPITRLEDLRAGDRLYFWEAKRGKIGHTGIYQGNGYFIHASSSHGQVARDYLGQTKWLHILVAARRS